MTTENTILKDIDEYIANFPKEVQEILEKLRLTKRATAPLAEETISDRMPTFTLKGNLVHSAAYKKQAGFYPTPSGIEKFKYKLSAIKELEGELPH